jgi:predicted nucleotidyltransferase
MNIFLEDHQEILKLLLKHKVDFLLIGGYAVIFHGYRRTTGDMDLWLKPTNQNKSNLVNALREAGFDAEDLNALENLDFTKHLVFTIGTEPQKIDFITQVNLLPFEEADKNKAVTEFEHLEIPVINLRELILTKINTGRKKDEADIEELQKIIQRNKDKS